MPVWFPPLDKLETFIPEPEWLRAGGIDEGSFETAEGSLEQFGDEDFYETTEDFGNTSMAFNDDMILGEDDMFYFDSLHDIDDLKRCVLCGFALPAAVRWPEVSLNAPTRFNIHMQPLTSFLTNSRQKRS